MGFILLDLNIRNCKNKEIAMQCAGTVLNSKYNYLIKKLNICSNPFLVNLEDNFIPSLDFSEVLG